VQIPIDIVQVRAGNEHTNAFVKGFRIMNGTFRGRQVCKVNRAGRQNLKACVFFCCNVRAAHHEVFPKTRRDLSVFEGLPVLDRAAIARHGDRFLARVKARHQQPPRHRVHQSSDEESTPPASLSSHSSDEIVINDVSDDDGALSVSSVDDNFSFASSSSSIYQYDGPRLAQRQPGVAAPPSERPHGDLLKYVVDLPGGVFDVQIVSINDEERTAEIRYLGDYAHHADETRPWATLRASNAAMPARRGGRLRR